MEGTFDIVKACAGWMWSITHACCKCEVGMGCLKWMTTSMSLQWFVCLGTFMLIQACSQVMSVQSICLCTFLSHCRCRVKEPKAKVGWWPLYFALGWAWRLGQGGGRGWEKQLLCHKGGEIDVGENEVHESLVDGVHDAHGVFVWKSFSPKLQRGDWPKLIVEHWYSYVCFSSENLFYTFTPNLLMEIFVCWSWGQLQSVDHQVK